MNQSDLIFRFIIDQPAGFVAILNCDLLLGGQFFALLPKLTPTHFDPLEGDVVECLLVNYFNCKLFSSIPVQNLIDFAHINNAVEIHLVDPSMP